MEITFGVPKKRKRKEEFRDDLPALRIEAYRGENTSRRILINSLAMEYLDVTPGEHITLGFDNDNNAYIIKCDESHPYAYKINKVKPYLFTDSKMYKYLVDTYYGEDDTIDHDIILDRSAQDKGEPVKLITSGLEQHISDMIIAGKEETEKLKQSNEETFAAQYEEKVENIDKKDQEEKLGNLI